MKKISELLSFKDKSMRKSMGILKEKESKKEKRENLNIVDTLVHQWELDSCVFLLN